MNISVSVTARLGFKEKRHELKSITLEISEVEAASLESSLDQLLKALRRLDE